MLNFVETGSGTPVLALHGWSVDHRLMLGCLEPIFTGRPGYRRLYLDLPGMGRSPAPADIATSDDVLDLVDAFVDAEIGDEPFLLAGESYGGYLARALVRRRAAQVLGLALICPIGTGVAKSDRALPVHVALRPDPQLLATLDERLATEFGSMAVVQTPQTLRRFRDEIMSGLDLFDRPALQRIAEQWTLREDPEGGAPYTRPSLVITGRQDASVGYLDQFALLPHYPRASFVALDVAGHNLQIEQPELFELLVTEWLDRVAAESVAA